MMQPTTTITTPQLLACVYAVLALAGNASAVAPSGGGDYLSEIVVGKAVDLKDALPYDDLGIAHRGALNIIRDEFIEKCIFSMGGPQTKQEEVLSSSALEFAAALAYDAGIDGAFGGFKMAASRSVRTASDLHKSRNFAKKTVSVQMRSLNIRQDCLKEKKYLHEGFYNDLMSLPREDLSDFPDFSYPQYDMYRTFLDRWGTTYLSAAIEGGALEITMSETKDRDGSNEEIKNTLAASYFGLGSMNPSVSNALKKSQEGRDGYLNLLIAGGSKEARAAVQNRFEKMLDAPTTGSTADPSQPQNMTAIWSTSVESGYSVITKGKYVSWDKFPNDIFKGWSGAGSISKNFRAAISIHLANAWSSGCPVYYWNTIKRQCEMGKHDDIFNNKVKIIADNGNCVEYDFLTNTLVARRKDCNMGLSIFTFFAKDGFYSLQLVNKNRTLGSLKEDASMSLVPPTTILSQNFVFAPSNHILFTDESLDRKYAFVDTSATGGGKIGFKKQTPLKDQHEFKFYLEVYDGSRIGNPLSSQAEWKDFMVKYNSHYKAPFFRIITPFFGENMVIKPVAAKAPEPPKPEMPWWWPWTPDIYLANEDKEDLEQLWKFSSIKFIDNQIHVNITNAKDGEKFCLSSNVGTGSQTGRPGINVCDNHQGWILDYDAAEYEGSVRMRVPRTNLCLYRIELLVPQANMMKNSNSSSPSTKTSTTMIASGDDDDSSRKLDDGFRVESCDKESPEDLMSMFKFKVLLEDSMVMAAATATAKKDVE